MNLTKDHLRHWRNAFTGTPQEQEASGDALLLAEAEFQAEEKAEASFDNMRERVLGAKNKEEFFQIAKDICTPTNLT